jgi:hypothetical protein
LGKYLKRKDTGLVSNGSKTAKIPTLEELLLVAKMGLILTVIVDQGSGQYHSPASVRN